MGYITGFPTLVIEDLPVLHTVMFGCSYTFEYSVLTELKWLPLSRENTKMCRTLFKPVDYMKFLSEVRVSVVVVSPLL